MELGNYTVDVFRTVGTTQLKGGMEGTGAFIVTRDNNSKSEKLASFMARGKSDPNQVLAIGYDTAVNEGWIQSCHYGQRVTRLHLQPNGNAGVVVGNPAGGDMGKGTINVRGLYVNGVKIA